MSVFIRRFLTDPGNEVLLEIESVNILDLDPPASITGVGTGTVICVGEYEDGPFATGGNANGQDNTIKMVEPVGATDFVTQVGELGYRYNGVPANHPSARKRRADGAIVDETWNGNAFVQLNGKKFKRLICLRVDTSVGAVEFRRRAYVTGAAAFAYNLEPGQIAAFDIGGGPASATFSATAGTVTSGGGTYPSTFTGGETLTLGYDDASNFTVTFLAADQTKTQVIARINTYAGFSFAADGGGALMSLTGLQRGTGGQVRVVSGSAGVLTALGLTAATTTGTGNVSNIDAVTFNEVRTIIQAAIAGTTVEQDSEGQLRVSKNYVAGTDYIQVGSATTATALGFTAGVEGSADGIANYRSTAQTFVTVGSGTLTLGVDDEANFNVTIGAGQSQATVIANINTAAGYTMASSVSGTIMLLRGRANGGQVRVVAAPNAVLTDLGLVVSVVSVPAIATGTLPAGTVVRNAANDRVYVTMQTVRIDAPSLVGTTYTSNSGPYSVKVRHATDDGTGQSSTAGSVVAINQPPDLGSFDVVNPQIISACLSESQIDANYLTAMDATLDPAQVSREANVIFSARQSNAIRRALRSNALSGSAALFGRMAIVRPPLGTTRARARSRIAEPGVGAYRDQRVVYTYPGVRTLVPLIARRGLGGGTGFTADGLVDVGSDGFLASIMSQLAPEENPGQLTTFTDAVISLESSSNAQGFQEGDYTLFRASGICAPRMEGGVLIFQSGVTSVDPGTFPNLKNIARRRMADFIQDTLARRGKAFGKKLNTFARRQAVTSEFRAFLDGLLSRNQPALQRIGGYTLDPTSGNNAETLARGLFRLIVRVKTLSSMDSIVIESTIGESVTVSEVIPELAA